MADTRKPYDSPRIEEWGTVQELTQTGQTNPGADAKQGSVLSAGA